MKLLLLMVSILLVGLLSGCGNSEAPTGDNSMSATLKQAQDKAAEDATAGKVGGHGGKAPGK